MARYGFRGERKEMKQYILYVMRLARDHVTLEDMQEMMLIDDRMNYFLFCDCIAGLVDSELLLKEKDKKGETVYTVTPRGYEIGEILQDEIPMALRRAAEKNALVVLNRVRRDRSIDVETVERGGNLYARLTMTDGVYPMLTMELTVANKTQADALKKNFRKNAENIFNDVLRAVLNPYEEEAKDDADHPSEQH